MILHHMKTSMPHLELLKNYFTFLQMKNWTTITGAWNVWKDFHDNHSWLELQWWEWLQHNTNYGTSCYIRHSANVKTGLYVLLFYWLIFELPIIAFTHVFNTFFLCFLVYFPCSSSIYPSTMKMVRVDSHHINIRPLYLRTIKWNLLKMMHSYHFLIGPERVKI